MNQDCCFLFPAFGIDYSENDQELVNYFIKEIKKLIDIASKFVDINFNDFILSKHQEYFDEIKTQYITYICSCAFSDFFKEKLLLIPDYIASYSMGIYAALYSIESVSFQEGLDLLNNAYLYAKEAVSNLKFGMGGIIGLEHEDISNIIADFKSVKIINVNSKLSYAITGFYDEIIKVQDIAKGEGALNTKTLQISTPFHTKFMETPGEKFRKLIQKINIKSPKIKYISAIDQRIIDTKEEIEIELVNNLKKRLNWFMTMKKIIELNNKNLIECGLGKSLLKIGKFIEGDFKINSVRNFIK